MTRASERGQFDHVPNCLSDLYAMKELFLFQAIKFLADHGDPEDAEDAVQDWMIYMCSEGARTGNRPIDQFDPGMATLNGDVERLWISWAGTSLHNQLINRGKRSEPAALHIPTEADSIGDTSYTDPAWDGRDGLQEALQGEEEPWLVSFTTWLNRLDGGAFQAYSELILIYLGQGIRAVWQAAERLGTRWCWVQDQIKHLLVYWYQEVSECVCPIGLDDLLDRI